MNILLVEPDVVMAKLYGNYLEQAGHTVRIAHDGQIAIEMVDDKPPELIILELLLGIHNGIEFLHELRSYPDLSACRVVIHSLMSSDQLQRYQPQWRLFAVEAALAKSETSLKQLLDAVENA